METPVRLTRVSARQTGLLPAFRRMLAGVRPGEFRRTTASLFIVKNQQAEVWALSILEVMPGVFWECPEEGINFIQRAVVRRPDEVLSETHHLVEVG